MCNRCDGGNKKLIKFQCDNPSCQFIFYQVEDDNPNDEICVKCRIGLGKAVNEGEV